VQFCEEREDGETSWGLKQRQGGTVKGLGIFFWAEVCAFLGGEKFCDPGKSDVYGSLEEEVDFVFHLGDGEVSGLLHFSADGDVGGCEGD